MNKCKESGNVFEVKVNYLFTQVKKESMNFILICAFFMLTSPKSVFVQRGNTVSKIQIKSFHVASPELIMHMILKSLIKCS